MTDTPLVSVIMPAYNAGRWIAAAIRSALDQSIESIEVIVVDDGSSDTTRAEVLACADPRVQLVSGSHRGAAAARNQALARARGRYIQHLDADDLLAADKLAPQIARLEAAGPEYVASGRWIRFSQPEPSGASDGDALWQDLAPVAWLQAALADELMMHPAAWLLPRERALAAGPWNESLSLNDDGEYFARVLAGAKRVLFVPEALSWYRSGLSGTLSARPAWDSAVAALEGITGALLNLDSDTRSRHAAAQAWARLAVQLWPVATSLSRDCLQRAQVLDPSVRPGISGGARTRQLADWIGWRGARWLQYRVRRH